MQLEEFLDEEKMTPAAFARKGSFSKSNVSLWLANKRSPGPDNIERIRQVTRNKVGLKDWVNRRKLKKDSTDGNKSKRT